MAKRRKTAAQARFARAARACKGKKKGAFRACLKKKLRCKR